MRIWTVVALAMLLPDGAMAQTISNDPQNSSITSDMQVLPVHVGGRARVQRARGPRGSRDYVHDWPGVYFESAFEGDRVLLRFDDAANEYRLLIDDLAPLTLAQPGRTEMTVAGLTAGPHRLRLEKVTESVDLLGKFGGYYVPAGAKALPIQPRTRQIEYIGDSSMSGFGARSGTRECSGEEQRLTSDTQSAYPALVAKHFNADYQINAISARGVVRNYAGLASERVMPKVYPYATTDRWERYKNSEWQPQIVVIKLNADFVGDLTPLEQWKTFAQVAKDYVKGYSDFLAEVHRRSPGAAILIAGFGARHIPDADLMRTLEAGERSIVAAARAAGVRSIDFIDLEAMPLERTACSAHHSLSDHRRIASGLIAYLEGRPDLWNVKTP